MKRNHFLYNGGKILLLKIASNILPTIIQMEKQQHTDLSK